MRRTPDGRAATAASRRAGGNLACQLARAGITKDQLADHLGVHRTQVSRYISGRTPMNVDTIDAAASFLGCKPADIVKRDDEAVA